jgi:DNA-binding XRE family transcriptional regulator
MNETTGAKAALPIIPLDKCLAVFERAKIGQGQAAALIGVSRMSLYLWRKGRKPHSFVHERVSTLAHAVVQAIKAQRLPLGKNATIEQLHAAIYPTETAQQ